MGKYIISTYVVLGLLCCKLYGGWQERIDSINTLIEYAQDDSTKAEYLLDLGVELLSNSPGDAFAYFFQAQQLSESLKDTLLIVKSKLSISDAHTLFSDYSVAIELIYDAIKISEGNYELLSRCNSRLAGIYDGMSDYEESLRYNRLALKYDRITQDTQGIAIEMHNMALCFIDMEHFDSALIYLFQSLVYADSTSKGLTNYIISHIGLTYTYMGMYDSALYYHKQAFISDSIADLSYEMAYDDYYMAITYFEMENYEKSLSYLNRSLNRAKFINLLEVYLSNYDLAHQIYEKLDNYLEAYKYAILLNTLADSFADKNNESLIHNFESKLKFQEQQRQLQSAESKNKHLKRHKTLLFAFSLVCIMLLFSTTIIIRQKQKQNKANRELLFELEEANESKEKLISVISHDLRGSIGTLRNAIALILNDKFGINDTIELVHSFFPVVDSTYDLLENLLTWVKHSKENLKPDYRNINIKSIVERSVKHTNHIAEAKRIKIVVQVKDLIVSADENMLLMVMRNLISNAVKFSNPDSQVTIRAIASDHSTKVVVVDKGVGLSKNALERVFDKNNNYHSKGTMGERGSGLGLTLCKYFIERHNGIIHGESLKGSGSSFYFILPTKQNGN